MPPRRRVIPRLPKPHLPPSGSSLTEIVEQINAASKELGRLTTERDEIKTANKKLQDENAQLQNTISQARIELDNLRSQANRASQAHLALDADHATKKASYALHIADLEAEIARLNSEIAALNPLRREIAELKGIKEKLNQELDYLEKNITFIRDEHRAENDSMEIKRAEIRAEIEKLESLIEKNGAITKAIEQDRAKLEIYIRRLQRYYDESGINLSILHEFDMKHYGQ